MRNQHLRSLYSLVKMGELKGRYITNSDIEKCLKKFPNSIYNIEGYSVEGRPIYSLKLGRGPRNVLLWSQMHGNESTTTKAVFDCFNLFLTNNDISNQLLERCTILVIPILNPDGAERYTRLNANGIDLNRDAKDLSQRESKVLRAVFEEFQPDYCFNLHGQRTIYNVGTTAVSSTLSFLSPSQDNERSITDNRKVAMQIISGINEALQEDIPKGVARYDDSFNINCVGDMFQSFSIPTLLFEAGHLPGDYNREDVRYLMYKAILIGLEIISNDVKAINYENYFQIPENGKQFYDVIIRNARLSETKDDIIDIAIQFEETLIKGKIEFIPVVEIISQLDDFFGHREIDAKGQIVKSKDNLEIKVTNENDFVLINNEKIVLKP